MLNNIKANLYFLYKESFSTIIIFWVIFLASILVFFTAAVTFDGGISFQISTTIPVVIFTVIFGALYVKETFPYAVKLGTTRINFIASVAIYSIIYSAIMTALNLLFVNLFEYLIDRFNMHEEVLVSQFVPEFIERFGLWQTSIYTFFILITIFMTSILFSMILYRYGYIGGAISAVIILAFVFINQLRELAYDLARFVAIGHEDFANGYLIIPPTVAFLLFAILIIRASVISKTGKV